jgi:hypothetical protein
MKVPIRLFGSLVVLHLFGGCDQLSQKLGLENKSPTEEGIPPAEKVPSAPEGTSGNNPPGSLAKASQADEAAQFNADYEKWKLRAVEEFPEIGKAGSRFNQQFLIEAKKLRESNAPELAHPNWPYLLALQVNTSLERQKNATPPQASLQENTPTKIDVQNNISPPQDQQKNTDRFGSYDVADLTKMRELPKGGVFRGTITKVEKQIASGELDIVLVLDGILSCEINLDRNTNASRTANGFYEPIYYYRSSSRHSSLLEVIQEQNSLKLVEKNTASMRSSYTGRTYTESARRDLLTLKVGQTVSVEGMLLLKANKKPLLKGIIRTD